MIEGKFNSRTLAAMNAALDKVCARVPDGEDHAVRKRAAKEIIRCASNGHTTLDELMAAAERGLSRHGATPVHFDRRSSRLTSH
jgi:hypothetical protein